MEITCLNMVTNEFKVTIIELFNGGKSLSELSREYDVSKSTISTWVKKAIVIFKGNPYDNAPIESFHASLKKEEVITSKYIDFKSAKLVIFEYMSLGITEKEFIAQLVISHSNYVKIRLGNLPSLFEKLCLLY